MTGRLLTQREQLEAQDKLRALATKLPDTLVMGKVPLARIGESLLPHTYATTDSDEAARYNWYDFIESIRFTNPENHFVYTQQARLPDAIILMMGGARWVKEGCPVYRPGHKQAAVLMATRVSPDVAEHVKPPHRAFFIDLPNGLLEMSSIEGGREPAIGIFVQMNTITERQATKEIPPGEYWNWICMTKSLMIWQANRRLDEMISGALQPQEYFGLGYEMDEHDLRLRRLVVSLIVSLCLDLASGRELKHKVEPVERLGKKAAKDGLNFNVFLDPEPIDVDARPFVQAYLAGDRNSPAFQHVVGMHWKSQAYGPGHSLRRPIKIMPYKRFEHLPAKAGYT